MAANVANVSFSKVQGKEVKKSMHRVEQFCSSVANDVKEGNYAIVRKLAASLSVDMYNTEKFIGSNKTAWQIEKLAEAERNLQGYTTEEDVRSSKEFALLSSKNKMYGYCRNFLPCYILQTADQQQAAKQAAEVAAAAAVAAKKAAILADAAKKAASEAAKAATTEAGVAAKQAAEAEAAEAVAAAEAAAVAAADAAAEAAKKEQAGSLKFAKEKVVGYRINSLTDEEIEKFKKSASWQKVTLNIGKDDNVDEIQYFVLLGINVDSSEKRVQRKKIFSKAEYCSRYYLKADKVYTMQAVDFLDYDTLFSVLSYAVQVEKAKAKAAEKAAAAKAVTLQNIADAEAAKLAEYNLLADSLKRTMQLNESARSLQAIKKQVAEAEEIAAKFAIKASEEAAAAVAAAAKYVADKAEEKKQKQAAKRAEAKKQAEAAKAAEAGSKQDAEAAADAAKK